MACAGAIALSAAPAQATSYGREIGPNSTIDYGRELGENLSTNCGVTLTYNSYTKWAYAEVIRFRPGWTCKGFVKNSHGSQSWTRLTSDSAWSGGVWRAKGYKAQACVYVYYKNRYKTWACTKWH
ncbi:hypothetical protein E0H75_07120 [Kribbella capetownensis]|uniref:Uncharacterized protein n=1 Tax=Kribbella capetownensis TaxID=1572659 RepID=A0A4R0K3Y4_9ACTN|nr:hypothetical protein [Kribbella capetownensis]TCC53454.1 hypothetical protein E0H75_07120 [Kribbella capetownensis]